MAFVMVRDSKHNNLAMLLSNQCVRLAQEWEKPSNLAFLAMALELFINKQKKLSQFLKE